MTNYFLREFFLSIAIGILCAMLNLPDSFRGHPIVVDVIAIVLISGCVVIDIGYVIEERTSCQ